MAIRFLDTILSGSLAISGSYTLPTIDTGSTGVLGQMGINGEVPHFYSSQGWQAVSGSKFTPLPPPSVDIEYLVVAGGGGGGGTIAGGGGAGGLLSGSISSVESGSSFTIVVGAGGDGGHGWGTYTAASPGATSSLAGSSITTISTVGGGLGGDHYGNSSTNNLPGDGGSGGGGGRGTSYPLAGGSGTAGQGNDGGSVANSSTGDNYGSGGGGAGAAGDAAGADADGGIGKQSSITGTATYYAGGGGGGVRSSAGSDVGEGGLGGGGAGGTAQSATSGTANTGGGGGGAGYTTTTSAETGGKGGSGVVILRYPTGSSFGAFGGNELKSKSGERIHQFNTSGTFQVGSSTTFPPLENHYPTTVTKPNIFINPKAIGADGTFDTISDYGSVGRDFHNAGGSNNTKINTAAGSYDALDNVYASSGGARGFVAGGTTLGVVYSDYNTNQDHSYNMFFRYDPSMESDLNYPLLWMVKPNTADNSTSYYGGIQIAVWRGGYSEVGKLYAGLYAVSNGSNVHGTTQTTTRTSGDTWYMATVVVTYGSSGNIKIYLNGSLETTSSTADNTSTGGSSNHVSIGESYWSAASVNPGGMTIGVSHAWFGTALTATDVTNLWNFYKADYGLS